MNYKIIQVLGFLLIAVFLTPFVTSAAIGVTWTATSTTPGYISPNTINGYAPGIGVTGNSNFNMGTNSMTGFGSSSPYANIAIHANNGETSQTLFAIGSSTQTATTTLFTVDNSGTVHVKGSGAAYTNIGQFTGSSSFGGIGFATTPGVVNVTGYSMIGDGTNTYINNNTGGFTTFRQANQDKMYLNSSGNFGIGTTSPVAKLSVHANAGETNPYLFTIASSTGAFATTTLFSIDNTGQVTVTNTAFNSINSSGGVNTVSGFYTTTNQGLYWNNSMARILGRGATNDSANYISFVVGTSSPIERARFLNTGQFGIGTSSPFALTSIHAVNGFSTSTILFAIGSSTQTATTTLFAVTNSGNVGIGVNTPSTQLQVAANSTSGEMTPVILQNVSNANGAATSLGFSQNATLSGPLTGKISSIRNSAASFDMALYSSTGAGTVTEGLRLTSARNLGVGSTSPQAKLAVHANNGDTNTQLFTVASSTQTATTTLFSIDNVGNSTQGIGSTSSTTQTVIGKWQMDTYNTAGTQICAFFVGTTLSASTGACNK